MVDPTYMPVNRVSPLVSIEQVSADDAPLSAQASLEIGPELLGLLSSMPD